MFKERAVLNVWRSESNVLTDLFIQLDTECFKLTKRTVKWKYKLRKREKKRKFGFGTEFPVL